MRMMQLLLLVLTLSALNGSALASQAVSVVVNDYDLKADVAPIVQQGRVLVPVRAIAETLFYYC